MTVLTFLSQHADLLTLLPLAFATTGEDRRKLRDRRIENVLMESDEHVLHHAFIRELLQEKAEQRAFREKLKNSVAGWLLIAVIGGVGTLVYRGMRFTLETLK